ncbi:universal stress protein, partial [Acinetobacter baumannii]
LRLHRDDLLTFALGHGVPADRCHLLYGPVDTALHRFVDNQRADVLVLGSSQRTGFEHWLKGDTVERLLPHLSCDVLVVHPKSDEWIPST